MYPYIIEAYRCDPVMAAMFRTGQSLSSTQNQWTPYSLGRLKYVAAVADDEDVIHADNHDTGQKVSTPVLPLQF